MKNILFITTHNLATNPRLVKEIKLANQLGYGVNLICFDFDNWSKEANERLLKELVIKKLISIPAGRKPFYSWFKSVVIEKAFRWLSSFLPLTSKTVSFAVSRRSLLLLKAIRNIETADLVIGHNPGAIYATLVAAECFNCRSGFDVEDYHPGETHDERLKKITLSLMQKTFPRFNYLSFASESIFDECKKEINISSSQSTFVINNSFSSNEFMLPIVATDDKLHLVWFSQHIDKGRGLEQLIPMVSKNADKLSLTLFGNCNTYFKIQHIDGKPGIILGGTHSQVSLHQKLAAFDLGLAIEPGKDLNNELALSNKFFAYLQAGLFILATDTIEQKRFINMIPGFGQSTKKNFEHIEKDLLQIHSNLNQIRKERMQHFEIAKFYSWENNNALLIEKWNYLINN